MDRGTPATERLGGAQPTSEPGPDPRTPARGEPPKGSAPLTAQGYEEVHVEAHIILSEN